MWTPVEQLLLSGGDSRVDLDCRSGLSRYGCAAHPRDALPLGSCSASSPSPEAIEAVHRAFAALSDVDEEFRRVRCAIAELLMIDPGLAQVVLTREEGTYDISIPNCRCGGNEFPARNR